jgi:hypothetical protein
VTIRDLRALILIDGGDDAGPSLQQSVGAALESISRLVAPASVRFLSSAPPALLDGTHVQSMFAGVLDFQVALDLCVPALDAISDVAWCELSAELDAVAGSAQRSVLVGQQWRSDGDALPFGMWLFNSRLPGRTRDEFVHHWRHTHARIDVPPVKAFCQMYADDVATAHVARLLSATPLVYDGVSGPSWDDEHDFRHFMLDDRIRVGAAKDEVSFIDHSRSHVAVTRVVEQANMVEQQASVR